MFLCCGVYYVHCIALHIHGGAAAHPHPQRKTRSMLSRTVDRAAHGIERLNLFALERLRSAAEPLAEQRPADYGRQQQRGAEEGAYNCTAEEDASPDRGRHVSPRR